MHISNMKIVSSGIIELLISDELKSTQQLCFCERIEQGIWDVHYRQIPWKLLEKNVYCFDAKQMLKTFEYDREKVFDFFVVDMITQKESPIEIALEKDLVNGFSQLAKVDEGEIKCNYYKNSNNRLSVKAKFTPSKVFRANVEEIEGKKFEITLHSDCSKHIDWFFARKTTSDNTLRYDKVFAFNVGFETSNSKIVVSKNRLLFGLSQGGGERWELIARVDGINFAVHSDKEIKPQEFEIDQAVKAKIKAHKDGVIQIETLENANDLQSKIKVAVMGSCFTRQAFNSKDYFNPDYKRFYRCDLTAYHFSFPSIMSSPITVDPSELVGMYLPDLNMYGKSHFDKDFLEKLEEYKPEYLIVENYVHITAALIETKTNSYIDENYYLVDSPAFKNLDVLRRIRAESEEHFEIYKKALLQFKEKIRGIIPFENIILVRTQPALKKNENGIVSEWDTSQQIKYRRHIWERYDSYFIMQFPEARVIDMRNDKYISEKCPYLKFAPSHFGSDYYRELLNYFNKVTLQDLIKERGRNNEV